MSSLGRWGQTYREYGAPFGMIAGGDVPAVPLDNSASQGEAEAGASRPAGVEGLENPFLFAGRDALAPVANLDDEMAIRLHVEGDIDRLPGQRSVASVSQQIDQHLF